MEPNEILDHNLTNDDTPIRRRALIPLWMKVFVWIFLILGILAPFGLVIGLFSTNFLLALYGFETNDPLSITGLSLITIFMLKGITAYGLWTEKNWAINIAQMDAIFGIIICLVAMAVLPFTGIIHGFKLTFRIELLLLIPYLIKLNKMKEDWLEAV